MPSEQRTTNSSFVTLIISIPIDKAFAEDMQETQAV